MAAPGTAPPTQGSGAGEIERAGSPVEAGDAGDGSDGHGARWFWRIGFPVAMALLVLAIPVLVLAGRDVVLNSNEGAAERSVSDASAPGFRALTDPTPTMLVLATSADGALEGATVLSLADDTTGGVLFIPTETSPVAGEPSLRTTAEVGTDEVRAAVETTIGAVIGDVTEVPHDAWADLVAPVAPLAIENPDDVYVTSGGTRTLRFPRGPLRLAATDVADYLFGVEAGSAPSNVLVRQQVLWSAWLAAVGGGGDDAVPGEKDSGLGKFVRALGVDRVEMASLPVQKVPIPGSTVSLYLPIAEQVQATVARLVPFPIGSPPGSRIRIELLDGTGTLDNGIVAAPVLVQANGQIDLVGNADTFGQATTRLEYGDERLRDEVERLRAALGVGEVVTTNDPGGSADVTITLGQDYAASGKRSTGETPSTGG